MSIDECNPLLRWANHRHFHTLHFGPRYKYAYQLFYVFQGRCWCRLDGQLMNLSAGSLVLFGPQYHHEISGSDGVEIASVKWSWTNRPEWSKALGYGHVAEWTTETKSLADPMVQIHGIPDLPLVRALPTAQRVICERLLKKLGPLFRGPDFTGKTLECKALLMEIFVQVLQAYEVADSRTRHIRFFQNYIHNHYHQDLDRNRIAAAMGLSASYVTALVKKELATNVSDYLTHVRLDMALELVEMSDKRIKDIAHDVGYKDSAYFVKCFKQRYGVPPHVYRSGRT